MGASETEGSTAIVALVSWNQHLNEGAGRSGSRYEISRYGAAGDGPWLVVVDGDALCAAGSPREALTRVEDLEALRCFLRGFGTELSMAELDRAGLAAAQMFRAAKLAGTDPQFPTDRRDQAESTWQRLRALHGEIEFAKCQRIAWPPPAPELVH